MKKQKTNFKWIGLITSLAFILSLLLSLLSELVIPNTIVIISIILVIIFISLGILFDIIGVAATTADEKVFHSMASQKIKGAKQAIKLITKKDKVSSFCNDVIGDICGVISGSCGVTIALKLSESMNISLLTITLITTSIISSLTIGGKALGKSVAVNNSNKIISFVGKILTVKEK